MHLLYAADHRADAYLIRALREAGHIVDTASEPEDALAMAGNGGYQAIVLDWKGAPAKCVARFSSAAPAALILVITETANESERAAVLGAGADACFTRPAEFIELDARLAALARLVGRGRTNAEYAGVRLSPAEQAVRLNGAKITLSVREFRVMTLLVDRVGEVVGPEWLHQQVWGEATEPRPDLVRACLARIKRKLAAAGAGASLRNVVGHGYLFQPIEAGDAPPPRR